MLPFPNPEMSVRKEVSTSHPHKTGSRDPEFGVGDGLRQGDLGALSAAAAPEAGDPRAVLVQRLTLLQSRPRQHTAPTARTGLPLTFKAITLLVLRTRALTSTPSQRLALSSHVNFDLRRHTGHHHKANGTIERVI